MAGTDPATFTREAPGMSAFALLDGQIHHTYSTYGRGLDGPWGCTNGSTAPLGRNSNEANGAWWRRRNEY